jgi:hypothetical protein
VDKNHGYYFYYKKGFIGLHLKNIMRVYSFDVAMGIQQRF